MAGFRPAYLEAYETGALDEKIRRAREIITGCTLCPRMCGVDRTAEETGVCKTGTRAVVSSYNPHYGEESPLVGNNGSGTIFFTHCNLLCIFCQNFDISHEGMGETVSDRRLAGMMLALQRHGCHNINFVSPSHVVPQILTALKIAVQEGLNIPLVYNSGGYDNVETIALLEGVFDIYMPDFKFWDPDIAEKACGARNYPEKARAAVIEMHRRVGDLQVDEAGVATRGLLVRHLVLPEGIAGTRDVVKFIADEISPDTYVNIMTQYRPCGRAHEMKALSVHPSRKDFEEAFQAAKDAGLTRLDGPRRVFLVL